MHIDYRKSKVRSRTKPFRMNSLSYLLLKLFERFNEYWMTSDLKVTSLHLSLEKAKLQTSLRLSDDRMAICAEIDIGIPSHTTISTELLRKLKTAIAFAFERSSCKWLRNKEFDAEKIIQQHTLHFFSLLNNAVAWQFSIVFLSDKILIQNPIISARTIPKTHDFKNRTSEGEIQIDHLTGSWNSRRICNLHLTGIRDFETHYDDDSTHHLKEKSVLSQIRDRHAALIPQTQNCPQQLLYFSLPLGDLISLAQQPEEFAIGSSNGIKECAKGAFRTNIPFKPEDTIDGNIVSALDEKIKDEVVVLDLRGEALERLKSSEFRFDASILISDSETRKKTSDPINNDCLIISFCDEPEHRIEASYLLDSDRVNSIPAGSMFEIHFSISKLKQDISGNLPGMYFLNEKGQGIFEFPVPKSPQEDSQKHE